MGVGVGVWGCVGVGVSMGMFPPLPLQSVLLPLSLSVMNSWKFSPRKDYSANRLVAGALQLAAGTHLLVDETALEPGRLSEVGVRNLAALGHVVQRQTVEYDFQFHTTEFECDLVSGV